MSEFLKRLKDRQSDPAGRRWIYVPYDQVTDEIGPLSREDPRVLGILLIENPWKAARRPYHRQKLALILANLRHFALEQAERGIAIRHVVANGPYRKALVKLADELGPIRVMEPAERELRIDLAPLARSGAIEIVPHEGWLTTADDFGRSQRNGPPYRMDAFYREVRKRTKILMSKGKPIGGKLSFDTANRQPWNGTPPAPKTPGFPDDPIKLEISELIETHFARHPGKLDLSNLPATKADADKLWKWFLKWGLENFGPYEDAMSFESRGLFHSRISALLNIHRLLPSRLVQDALNREVPLASKEGFLRQVLGWREFVRHIHRVTDGFRDIKDLKVPTARHPGDGGYHAWSGKDWKRTGERDEPDGGACPSFLKAKNPLPPVFWGTASGLACLDHVVTSVWEEAYSHHITRLMILSNIASLLDVSPRELTDWFWVAYADAFDWVVEPNVLGMGTFAAGDLMTTKPYVSGTPYIHKMSDYCESCAFDPKRNCPISRLYWAYLARHHEELHENARLRMPIRSLEKRNEAQRDEDRQVYDHVLKSLREGKTLKPDEFEMNP